MNMYLAESRAGNHKTPHPQSPSKPSKAGFEGFEGDRSRRISENGWIPKPVEGTPFVRVFEILQSRCPNWVPVDRWQQCVEDGKRFLAQWAGHAEVFDRTARDLFGLAPVPDSPHRSYRRLSRYDEIGVIWLLEGCEVLALTANTATIRRPSGSTTTYRKNNTSAFGGPSDSLDDPQ
jgi:hypothetical protein